LPATAARLEPTDADADDRPLGSTAALAKDQQDVEFQVDIGSLSPTISARRPPMSSSKVLIPAIGLAGMSSP
jgi:hypothetical protein